MFDYNVNVYDHQRFPPVDHNVSIAVIGLGVNSGLIVAFLLATPWFWVALAGGGVATMLIDAAYRWFLFPDGLPVPHRPGIISPGQYGPVAKRYFAKFTASLTCSFALGWILSAIFKAI